MSGLRSDERFCLMFDAEINIRKHLLNPSSIQCKMLNFFLLYFFQTFAYRINVLYGFLYYCTGGNNIILSTSYSYLLGIMFDTCVCLGEQERKNHLFTCFKKYLYSYIIITIVITWNQFLNVLKSNETHSCRGIPKYFNHPKPVVHRFLNGIPTKCTKYQCSIAYCNPTVTQFISFSFFIGTNHHVRNVSINRPVISLRQY